MEQQITQSPSITSYFDQIDAELKRAYSLATQARNKGLDPEDIVDIPIAKNMAERVIGLVSTAAPVLKDTTIVERIEELEKEFTRLDWRVGFKIAEEIAQEKFCQFSSKKMAMEVAIRVGFAYLTLGIVSAPLEGFIGLEIKRRRDGSGEYFSIHYAGPVRGAGGTASAVSVILADYVRVKMGYASYDPDEKEVSRYVTEITDYHERVTNLQYFPSEEELRFFARHLPVEINGDPTEKFEVSNYKDLPRVETNRIRGGICLVLAEGLCQKAPKIWKRLTKWSKDLELDHWSFLEDFLELQKKMKAKTTSTQTSAAKISPNFTFIKDMVAGRPVLTHPLVDGGFRLRYGRGRTSGFSATCLHPSTLAVLENFIAVGTQLKIERPGKATSITVCESLEGPIILLEDGTVVAPQSVQEVKELSKKTKEILFLGDLLISYGDFSENNHKLVPAGYCEEWWALELEKAISGGGGFKTVSGEIGVSQERLKQLVSDYFIKKPTFDEALIVSKKLHIPLHPSFTYFFGSLDYPQLLLLLNWLKSAEFEKEGDLAKKIILPFDDSLVDEKRVLEILGIPHNVVTKEYVVISKEHAKALHILVGNSLDIAISLATQHKDLPIMDIINKLSPVIIRDKCGTFIGARMGRPEKAKMRKLTGSPHVLFPVGKEGDRFRSFNAALTAKKVTANFPVFLCSSCNEQTVYKSCERCNTKTIQLYNCNTCGVIEDDCIHGAFTHSHRSIDIEHFVTNAKKRLDMRVIPELIKGVRGTSNKDHVVENFTKGLLRAKYNIHVNKDGTTRYDMTELPITHFVPSEIGTSIEQLRSLGYQHDTFGNDLIDIQQVVELKPQDVILPSNQNAFDESANKVLLRVSRFIDELLEKHYGLTPYYNCKTDKDLIGHLVIGLAPHISAGLIGRIIGFSQTQGCYAHPLWHAGLRRDCDGDEACVMLLLDALVNFSRQYLPNRRGAKTMDSPLVLTAKLNPAEVDDQVHGLDVMWRYPLELYEAALEYKDPWEVDVEQLKKRLGKPSQFEGLGYTHPIININNGVLYSAYKSLPTMAEKLKGQMRLATKIRAVDTTDVSRLVIERHFLKDLKGNLRKFSQQQFRCVKCNTKFRRPPLVGKCTKCSGKIIFTISYGSIVKYLEPSMNLAHNYNVSPYLHQSLEVLQDRIESVFGRDKEKQVGLGDWA